MKVFLTGGTGLLGINIVHALLAQGHEIAVLVRDRRKAERVLPVSDRITLIDGDIGNPEPWLSHLRGRDALIHAAAYFREYFGVGDHASHLEALNVALPLRLVKYAAENGVKKSIIISSSGVISPRTDNLPTDERDAPKSFVSENAYFNSKVKMEQSLTKLAPELTNTLILIRPGWMFGPNDYAPTGTGQMIIDLLRDGSLQLVGGSPMGIADARDVAFATVAALEKVDKFEIFNVAGNLLPAIDALKMVADISGGRIQEVPVPMALLLSAILEPISRWQKKPNPIPRVGLLTLHHGVSVSSEKAKNELGVSFRPFAETARDTVDFIRGAFAKEILKR